ncbi:hypothetical protein ACFX1S_038942 [Malus domestica]
METSLPFVPSQTCDGENGGYCQTAGGFRGDAAQSLRLHTAPDLRLGEEGTRFPSGQAIYFQLWFWD